MSISFEDCLSKRKLFKFAPAKRLIDLELDDAAADLKSAKEDFANSSFKWATIKGYYSMFHSARALVYSRGYREKSHYCLYVALKALFVEDDKLSSKLAEDFNNSMILREDADYRRSFSEEGASGVIKSADKFFDVAKKLLA